MALQADVNPAAQECADGQHNGTRTKFDAALRDHADHALALDLEIGYFLLEQREIRLGLEHAANRLLVELSIGLRTRGAYRGSLAGIQGAELDAGLVRRECHGTAQRIDLLHQVTLADAADRRIAAHLTQRLDVAGQEQGTLTHARSRKRGLGARMAPADHDHPVFRTETHDAESTRFSARRVL